MATASSRPSSAAVSAGGESFPQFRGRLQQVLVHDLDLGEHRHEVRVPVPTRHHVKMHVVGNAGAGGAAGVGADVESLRLQLFTENSYRALGRAHQVGGLDIVERIE